MDGLSGTASAFAVVSLAGQVAAGLKNLYQFWSSFNDAPDYVQGIDDDLQLLMTVLRGIQDNEQQYGPDPITIEVLQKCDTQIRSITAITHSLGQQLAGQRSSRRAWAALRTTFKQDKITKIQEMLRDTKVTLVLAQQNGFSRNVNACFAQLLQHQSGTTTALTQLQANFSSPLVLETRPFQPDHESHGPSMQCQLSHALSKTPNSVLSVGLERGMRSALNESFLAPQQPAVPVGEITYPDSGNPSYQRRSNAKVRSKCAIPRHSSESTIQNLFGIVRIHSEVRQVGRSLDNDPEDLDKNDFVRTTSFRIRPASWLIQLGFCFELHLTLEKSAQVWKHTLNALRPVPNNAPIFAACRNGDIGMVEQLLTNGEASVWDCTEDGRLPIHFAASGCQPNVCQLLIHEGAEKTLTDHHERSALFHAIQAGGDGKRDPTDRARIDTLRLFLDDVDFSADAAPWLDGVSVLFLYRLNHHTADSGFNWLTHSLALEMSAYAVFDVKGFILLVYRFLKHGWRLSVLKIINQDNYLSLNNSYYYAEGRWGIVQQSIVAYHGEADQNAAILMAKGANPHSIWTPLRLDKEFTPTAIAMLASMMFYNWRANIYLAGMEIQDFVKRECQIGSVKNAGWNEESLLLLFRTHFVPHQHFNFVERCPRCQIRIGTFNEPPELKVVVEIAWCLELEDIKKSSARCKKDPEIQGYEVDSSQAREGTFCLCVHKYELLCLFCWEALHDPDHHHGDISRSETCPEVEQLLDQEDAASSQEDPPSDGEDAMSCQEDPLADWEDSMFLLSI